MLQLVTNLDDLCIHLSLALCIEHINREPSTKYYICYTLGFCEGRWTVDALGCSGDERPPEFGIWGIALSPLAAATKVSNIKWSQPTSSVPSCTAWSSQDSEWMFYLKAPRSRFSAPCGSIFFCLFVCGSWLWCQGDWKDRTSIPLQVLTTILFVACSGPILQQA